MNKIEVNAWGLKGIIYQTYENTDRYSFQLGGFYNWHCPLKECMAKAEDVMKKIAIMKIEREFKIAKRRANKILKGATMPEAGLK